MMHMMQQPGQVYQQDLARAKLAQANLQGNTIRSGPQNQLMFMPGPNGQNQASVYHNAKAGQKGGPSDWMTNF